MLGVYKAISKAPDLAVLGLNGSGQRAAVFGGVLVSCCRGAPLSQMCTDSGECLVSVLW